MRCKNFIRHIKKYLCLTINPTLMRIKVIEHNLSRAIFKLEVLNRTIRKLRKSYRHKKASGGKLCQTARLKSKNRNYQYLERAAKNAEVTTRKKSRWALFSERVQKNPSLRGAGEYVRKCSKELREDFALKHDEE
ncbi:MAG: hypothetical protein GY797_28745 [Deltaproteobacteria bacterium]|nr:hypothetical protein [Deltaproteobacteria bacterium]